MPPKAPGGASRLWSMCCRSRIRSIAVSMSISRSLSIVGWEGENGRACGESGVAGAMSKSGGWWRSQNRTSDIK
eukprot:2189855-Prymnesium_polylepis.1